MSAVDTPAPAADVALAAHAEALGDTGLKAVYAIGFVLALYHIVFAVSGFTSPYLKDARKRALLGIFTLVWFAGLAPVLMFRTRSLSPGLGRAWWGAMAVGAVIKALMCLTEVVYFLRKTVKRQNLPVGATLHFFFNAVNAAAGRPGRVTESGGGGTKASGRGMGLLAVVTDPALVVILMPTVLWVGLLALATYDLLGSDWPFYVSLFVAGWNVLLLTKAVTTGRFEIKHVPNLVAHFMMQTAPMLLQFAVREGWLAASHMDSWYPLAVLAALRQLAMTYADTMLAQGWLSPWVMSWRVLYDSSDAFGTDYSAPALRYPNAFSLNYVPIMAVFAGAALPKVLAGNAPNLDVYILVTAAWCLGPAAGLLALEGAPEFPGTPLYRYCAPPLMMLYLTQYANLYKSPLWWTAFTLLHVNRDLLTLGSTVYPHLLGTKETDRNIYHLKAPKSGSKELDFDRPRADQKDPSFHKAVFKARDGAFLSQIPLVLWGVMWIGVLNQAGVGPAGLARGLVSLVNPLKWFAFGKFAVLGVIATLVGAFKDLVMLPVAIPRAALLPFQLLSEFTWVVEHVVEYVGENWPPVLAAVMLGIDATATLPLYMSETMSYEYPSFMDKFKLTLRQFAFLPTMATAPYVPGLVDRLGEGTWAQTLVKVLWWTATVLSLLSQGSLVVLEHGEGSGLYEGAIQALLYIPATHFDIAVDEDTIGTVAATIGFIGRVILTIQFGLSWQWGQPAWAPLEADASHPPLTAEAPWYLPVLVAVLVAWCSLMFYRRCEKQEWDMWAYVTILLSGTVPYLFPAMPSWLFRVWAVLAALSALAGLGLLVKEFTQENHDEAPSLVTLRTFTEYLKVHQLRATLLIYGAPTLVVLLVSSAGPALFGSPPFAAMKTLSDDNAGEFLAAIALAAGIAGVQLLGSTVFVKLGFAKVASIDDGSYAGAAVWAVPAHAVTTLACLGLKYQLPSSPVWAEVLFWLLALANLASALLPIAMYSTIESNSEVVEDAHNEDLYFDNNPFLSPFFQFFDGKINEYEDDHGSYAVMPFIASLVALALAVAVPWFVWNLAEDSWLAIYAAGSAGVHDAMRGVVDKVGLGSAFEYVWGSFAAHVGGMHGAWLAASSASALVSSILLYQVALSDFYYDNRRWTLLGGIVANNGALLLAFMSDDARLRVLAGVVMLALFGAQLWGITQEDPDEDLSGGAHRALLTSGGEGLFTALQGVLAYHLLLGAGEGGAFRPTGAISVTPPILLLLVIYVRAVFFGVEGDDGIHVGRAGWTAGLTATVISLVFASTGSTVAHLLVSAVPVLALVAMTVMSTSDLDFDEALPASRLLGDYWSEGPMRTTATMVVVGAALGLFGAGGGHRKVLGEGWMLEVADEAWVAGLTGSLGVLTMWGLAAAVEGQWKFATPSLSIVLGVGFLLGTSDALEGDSFWWTLGWWAGAAVVVLSLLAEIVAKGIEDLKDDLVETRTFRMLSTAALTLLAAVAMGETTGLLDLIEPALGAVVRPFVATFDFLTAAASKMVTVATYPFRTVAVAAGRAFVVLSEAVAGVWRWLLGQGSRVSSSLADVGNKVTGAVGSAAGRVGGAARSAAGRAGAAPAAPAAAPSAAEL